MLETSKALLPCDVEAQSLARMRFHKGVVVFGGIQYYGAGRQAFNCGPD